MAKISRLRLGRVVRIGLTVVLLAAVCLWFGGSPNLPHGPLHLKRGADGKLTPLPGESSTNGLSFEAHVGSIEARDSFSAVSTVSGNAGFSCRRIRIINNSDNLLMQCVGGRLLAELDKTPLIDEVEYYPHGFPGVDGENPPDAVVTLGLASIQESGFIDRSVDATVTVAAGNSIAHCNAAYMDNFSPPVIDYSWSAELHHQSITLGFASSATKYGQVSDDIAKQIAQTLSKFLNDTQRTYGPIPPLPTEFYPAYHPPPVLPFTPDDHAQRLASDHGLMCHDRTFWRLTVNRDVPAALTEMKTRMERAGWRTFWFGTNPTSVPHARMTKENETATIFLEEQFHGFPVGPATPSTGKPTVLIVQYVEQLTSVERDKAIAATFSKNVPLDTMLLFESGWQPEQRKLILARCEGPTTPRASLAMARFLHSEKRDEEARALLRRGFVTMLTMSGPQTQRFEMEGLAKELGIILSDDSILTDSALLEAGFVRLKSAVKVPDVDLRPDHPACYFGAARDGKLRTLVFYLSSAVTDTGRPFESINLQETASHCQTVSTVGIAPLGMPIHQSQPIEAKAWANFELAPAADTGTMRIATIIKD